MESSQVSITITIELVIAILIVVIIFDEVLTGYQLAGMLFILTAVVLMQLSEADILTFNLPVYV